MRVQLATYLITAVLTLRHQTLSLPSQIRYPIRRLQCARVSVATHYYEDLSDADGNAVADF